MLAASYNVYEELTLLLNTIDKLKMLTLAIDGTISLHDFDKRTQTPLTNGEIVSRGSLETVRLPLFSNITCHDIVTHDNQVKVILLIGQDQSLWFYGKNYYRSLNGYSKNQLFNVPLRIDLHDENRNLLKIVRVSAVDDIIIIVDDHDRVWIAGYRLMHGSNPLMEKHHVISEIMDHCKIYDGSTPIITVGAQSIPLADFLVVTMVTPTGIISYSTIDNQVEIPFSDNDHPEF